MTDPARAAPAAAVAAPAPADVTGAPAHGVSFAEAVRVWARVAALSFGGPAGQIAVMHRILVDEKRWIGEARFLHALNFCMLLPGPEAQQLTVYIGWLLHGVRGGLVAGTLFVLPGYLALTALSVLYATLGNLPAMQALFLGLKAAVLAIVLEAVIRIGRRALKNRTMWAIAALAFFAIWALAVPFPLIVLAAGLTGLVGGRLGVAAFAGVGGHGPAAAGLADRDSALGASVPDAATRAGARRAALVGAVLWAAPVLLLLAALGPEHVLSRLALFFSQMAVVTFGGAYAVLAWVAQAAVESYGWLAPGEMLDGLGMAETTPGPLIMVVLFVGFLAAFRDPGALTPGLAGILGGTLVTWVTFVPCFVWIFAGAPYVERLRANKALAAALAAITAAVVGVILNLAVWFALHVLFREVTAVGLGPLALDLPRPASLDPLAAGLTALALVAVFRLKLGLLTVVALAAAAGLVAHGARLAGLLP